MRPNFDVIEGCLFGCALGDSLGLPYEGARPEQVEALSGPRLVHSFTPFGSGYASDDTEHTRIVLQALIADPSGTQGFDTTLASGLRWWFLQLPVGIGLGTARACVRLLVGFGPANSGVNSAGNGPAMRSAMLGAFNQDPSWLEQAVRRTTRITHTDPRAEKGALLVAKLAAIAVVRAPTALDVRAMLEAGEMADAILPVLDGLKEGKTIRALVAPEGPSGFVLHTLPAVVGVVLSHPEDFEQAIECAVRLGGDTDTVAAIVGGIVGTRVGTRGMPRDWLEGYRDWPWDPSRLRSLVRATEGGPVPSALPVGILKVMVMLPLALGHLLRRLVVSG